MDDRAANDTTPPPQLALAMLRRMMLIRGVEERMSADSKAGLLAGSVHLYIGQEAVATGVCFQLTDGDKITSTHRGHGHYLAKGGDPGRMLAEVHAKDSGICRGMGGSMHVADLGQGILGANGIVGAGLGISAGAALAASLDGQGGVAVCFFGDGAANQGTLMETLNIAMLWKLPLVYVCEHNGFSEFSPAETVTSGRIADRARAFGVPCDEVDGNDVEAVWRAAGHAVARARDGRGPSFIEARTYRIHGHFEGETGILKTPYRPSDEIEAWRGRDPIAAYASRLVARGAATQAQVDALADAVAAEIDAAAAFAEAAPPARTDLAATLMFDRSEA